MTAFQVFEHQRIRIGEQLCHPDGEVRRFDERHFSALARFQEQQARPVFQLGHRSVTFRQFVGIVQIDDLTLEILPKLDRAAHGADGSARWRDALLRMMQIAGRLDVASADGARYLRGDATLIELVAVQYLRLLESLLHEGLIRRYRTVSANLGVFRGRLLTAAQVRENACRADRFFTEHAVFDPQARANEILDAALRVVDDLSLGDDAAALRRRVRARFPELETRTVGAADIDRLSLGRHATRYGPPLSLARWLLERAAPQLQAGAVDLTALLVDMNLLFQDTVGALLPRALPPAWRAKSQVACRFWRPEIGGERVFRADFVLHHDVPVQMVVDTKWRAVGAGPKDDELRQVFAYARVLGAPRAVLLYPAATDEAPVLQGSFLSDGIRCDVASLLLGRGGPHVADLRTALGFVAPPSTDTAPSSSGAAVSVS